MKIICTKFTVVYQMNFTNESDDDWNLFSWGSSMDIALDNYTQTPGPVLKVSQSLGIKQYLGKIIASGYVELYCVWKNSKFPTDFLGIKIHAPLHVSVFGYKPTWSVCTALDATGKPVWEDRSALNSAPFTFNSPNYGAVATPTPAHNSIEINTAIINKAK